MPLLPSPARLLAPALPVAGLLLGAARDLLLFPREVSRLRASLETANARLDHVRRDVLDAEATVREAARTVDRAATVVDRESDRLVAEADRVVRRAERLDRRSVEAIGRLDEVLDVADQVPGLDREPDAA